MIVRSMEKVENFSSFRISYLLKLYENTAKRRINLEKDYFFFCECSKCQDFETDKLKSSMICSKCLGCIPSITGNCVTCNYQIMKQSIQEHEKLKVQISNVIGKNRVGQKFKKSLGQKNS